MCIQNLLYNFAKQIHSHEKYVSFKLASQFNWYDISVGQYTASLYMGGKYNFDTFTYATERMWIWMCVESGEICQTSVTQPNQKRGAKGQMILNAVLLKVESMQIPR